MLDQELTRDLLAIELKTLGVSVTARMRWEIRCHEHRAALRFRDPSSEAGESSGAPQGANDASASSDVDLTTTDEGAWPRLIAIAASELVEQARAHAQNAAKNPPASGQAMVRLQPVAFAVTTKPKEAYLAAVGVGILREGNPSTTLMGADFRLDRRFGVVLLSLDTSVDGGTSNLGDVSVRWRFASGALGVGATLNLRVIDVDALAGFRWGWLVLKGETTSPSLSGRTLAGNSGGPLVAVRVRRTLGEGIFLGLGVELGDGLFPVRGSIDGIAPLLRVEGWMSATLSIGRRF